jgi:hypothetical protein
LRQYVLPSVAWTGVAALVVLLAVRDEMPLPPAAPVPDVSIAVAAGAAGAEHDGTGAFWWVTEPTADIWIFNNLDHSIVADARVELVAPPCGDSDHRRVQVVLDGTVVHQVDVAPTGSVDVDRLPLGPHRAATLRLEVLDAACSPGPHDPRSLYVMVRNLAARVAA